MKTLNELQAEVQAEIDLAADAARNLVEVEHSSVEDSDGIGPDRPSANISGPDDGEHAAGDRNSYSVYEYKGQWCVWGEDSSSPLDKFDTFEEAVAEAKDRATRRATAFAESIVLRDHTLELLFSAELPPTWQSEFNQSASSHYWLIDIPDGDPDDDGEYGYTPYKIRVSDHEPSIFRQREFGEEHADFRLSKNARLDEIVTVAKKVTAFVERLKTRYAASRTAD